MHISIKWLEIEKLFKDLDIEDVEFDNNVWLSFITKKKKEKKNIYIKKKMLN